MRLTLVGALALQVECPHGVAVAAQEELDAQRVGRLPLELASELMLGVYLDDAERRRTRDLLVTQPWKAWAVRSGVSAAAVEIDF